MCGTRSCSRDFSVHVQAANQAYVQSVWVAMKPLSLEPGPAQASFQVRGHFRLNQRTVSLTESSLSQCVTCITFLQHLLLLLRTWNRSLNLFLASSICTMFRSHTAVCASARKQLWPVPEFLRLIYLDQWIIIIFCCSWVLLIIVIILTRMVDCSCHVIQMIKWKVRFCLGTHLIPTCHVESLWHLLIPAHITWITAVHWNTLNWRAEQAVYVLIVWIMTPFKWLEKHSASDVRAG